MGEINKVGTGVLKQNMAKIKPDQTEKEFQKNTMRQIEKDQIENVLNAWPNTVIYWHHTVT